MLDRLDAVLPRLETEAPTPAQQRPRCDRTTELAALERALGGPAAAGPEPGAGDPG